MKMYSRVYAKIDLDAIHHNMDAMHVLLNENTKMFAVIKTDGYGHGAVPIAEEIEIDSLNLAMSTIQKLAGQNDPELAEDQN